MSQPRPHFISDVESATAERTSTRARFAWITASDAEFRALCGGVNLVTTSTDTPNEGAMPGAMPSG